MTNYTPALALISKLLENGEDFVNHGLPYELLQYYFAGLPIDTLRPLLSHRCQNVRRTGTFIASELGNVASPVLPEIAHLTHDLNRIIQWEALECIMSCSRDGQERYFKFIIPALEAPDDSIRRLAMRLISRATQEQLRASLDSLSGLPVRSQHQHRFGLHILLCLNPSNVQFVSRMLHSDLTLVRKYGAIIAVKNRMNSFTCASLLETTFDRDVFRFTSEFLSN